MGRDSLAKHIMTTPAKTTPADSNHPHYAWGASAAKQWRGCPGSVNFTERLKEAGKVPRDSSTAYSIEGTEAHDWAQKCLEGVITLDEIPAEFREHLEGYVDLANELRESAPKDALVLIEEIVPLFYNPTHGGTVDFAVIHADGVDFLDLKYGAGVFVDAEENDQLIIYAISLVRHYEKTFGKDLNRDARVRLHIYQPRHHSFDGLPSVFETTVQGLLDYSMDIQDDYKRSKHAAPEDLKPSVDACQFCDARRVCAARVLNLFEDIPPELNPTAGEPDVEAMQEKLAIREIDDQTRYAVFKNHKAIIKFFEELNEDTLALIESGRAIEGLKSIDGGLGNRAWGDEDAAEKLLVKLPAEKRYKPRRIISPTQAEKVLKEAGMPLDSMSTRFKNRFAQLISRKQGEPKLALASDKKPARVPAIEKFDKEVVDESDCF